MKKLLLHILNLKSKRRKLFASGFLVFLMSGIFVFQNCSDVKLFKPKAQQIVQGTSIPDASFCTRPGGLTSGLTKVVFVVDMSFSNIGNLSGNFNFNTSNATDYNGIRFQAITDFISTCGGVNPNNSFAITAFSDNRLPSAVACQPNFKPAAQALSDVTALKNLQNNTINMMKADAQAAANGQSPPYPSGWVMGETSYQDGLNCASTLLSSDISNNPAQAKNTSYLVFFVTDGKPSDNCDPSQMQTYPQTGVKYCPSSVPSGPGALGSYIYNPAYKPTIINMIANGRANGADARFLPVYYGPTSELPTAKGILDELAQAGESQSTVLISNVGSLNFCSLAQSPISTQYRETGFAVVNLTAKFEQGVMVPDSDMDGVPDPTDSNPTNARSQGNVLDGICRAAGGGASCTQQLCSTSKINGFHLTECDLASMNMTDGNDTDNDTIPDFVELLKGTDPIRADALSNLDMDNLNNIGEISVGRDVGWPDDDLSKDLMMDVTYNPIAADASCPANQQHFYFKINHVPLVQTLAYTDPNDNPNSSFKLSHAAGENVLLIYYTIQAVNATSLPGEVWGVTVKVPIGVPNPNINIQPTDFQRIGLIDGKRP